MDKAKANEIEYATQTTIEIKPNINLTFDSNRHLFKQFFVVVNPFDAQKWNSLTVLEKFLEVLQVWKNQSMTPAICHPNHTHTNNNIY